MRSVQLIYRQEGPGWAERSPQAPYHTTYAGSLDEARRLAHEGIAFHFETDEADLQITDVLGAAPGVFVAYNGGTLVGQANISGAFSVGLNVGEMIVTSTAPTAVRPGNAAAVEASTAA